MNYILKTKNKTMGFEFKSDQEPKQLVDSKTTLSANGTTINTVIASSANQVSIIESDNTTTSGSDESMDLVQNIFAEGEEERLAIQFIEENALYTKFLLWCGIQEQLKNLKDSLASPTE